MPFEGKSLPHAHLTVTDYRARINQWLVDVQKEKKPPNAEQLAVLRFVADRVLVEFTHLHDDTRDASEPEPMRMLVHGLPRTGFYGFDSSSNPFSAGNTQCTLSM